LNKIFVSAAAFYIGLKYLLKTQNLPYTTPMNADMFTSALVINVLQLTNSSFVAHVHKYTSMNVVFRSISPQI